MASHTAQPTLHRQASDQAHGSLQNFGRENRRTTSWRAHGRAERQKSRVMPSNNWCTSQTCHGDGVMLCQAELRCAVLDDSPLYYCWVRCLLVDDSGSHWPLPHSSTGHSVPQALQRLILQRDPLAQCPPWPAVAIHKPPRMTPDVNARALPLSWPFCVSISAQRLFLHRSLVMRVGQPMQAALLGG